MTSRSESERAILSNNFVKCCSDHLVIDLYYFPYGDKTVKYEDIRSCQLLHLKDLSIWKLKTWGMGFSSVWWPSDIRRLSRKYYIILDTNVWPRIGLTMDDKDILDVYEFIQQKINENRSRDPQSFDSIENVDPNIVYFEHQQLLKNSKGN